MLDLFLQMEVEKRASQDRQRQLTEQMLKLPTEAVVKLASGDLMKVSEENDSGWLERFAGTPLLQSAIALENEEIALAMEKNQHDMQQPPPMADYWQRIEQIRLKKKMLELQRVQQGAGPDETATPEAAAASQAATTQPAADQPEMGAAGAGKMAAQKQAWSLTAEGHKIDAERAHMRERHAAEIMRHDQEGKRYGYRDDEGKLQRGHLGKVLRHGVGSLYAEPRHEAHLARKHDAGKNSYNPFGGLLTPSKYEGKGATRLQYGKMHAEGVDKHASIDDFADHMGRELARSDFEKSAISAQYIGNTITRNVENVTPQRIQQHAANLRGFAQRAGAKASDPSLPFKQTLSPAARQATVNDGLSAAKAGIQQQASYLANSRGAVAPPGITPVAQVPKAQRPAQVANVDAAQRALAPPAPPQQPAMTFEEARRSNRAFLAEQPPTSYAEEARRNARNANIDANMGLGANSMWKRAALATGRIMAKQAFLGAAAKAIGGAAGGASGLSGLLANPKVQQAALGGAINAWQAPKGKRGEAFVTGAATTAVGNMGQGAQPAAATPVAPTVPSPNQIAATPPVKMALDMNMVREFAKAHPHAASAAAGAAAGGLWRGLGERRRDPMTGQEEGLLEAVGKGMATGGALGLGASAASKALAHESPMQSLSDDAEHGWSSIKKLLESKGKPAAEAASAAS